MVIRGAIAPLNRDIFEFGVAKAIKSVPLSQIFKLGELFAGAGGMALGAGKAELDGNKFSHVWINDIAKDACETFQRNIAIDASGVFCDDVKNLDLSKLPNIDGLVFGFPCNDFSIVGDRHGIKGEYGGLYRWGVKVLQKQKPLFFVAENVSGLASSGNDFEVIKNALIKTGYDIFPHKYHFQDYGVPQNRHRIIIVGFRRDLKIKNFEHPAPTSKDNPMSAKTALAKISKSAYNNELTKQSVTVVERLKHIKPGENAFTADIPEHLKLRLKSKATISQIYKRLKPDKPSYTVTGSGGGGTHVYHWKEHRALTNRERARLQSFPDTFEFLGNKESVRKQIGMAVPPQGAQAIFNAILEILVERDIISQC